MAIGPDMELSSEDTLFGSRYIQGYAEVFSDIMDKNKQGDKIIIKNCTKFAFCKKIE